MNSTIIYIDDKRTFCFCGRTTGFETLAVSLVAVDETSAAISLRGEFKGGGELLAEQGSVTFGVLSSHLLIS